MDTVLVSAWLFVGACVAIHIVATTEEDMTVLSCILFLVITTAIGPALLALKLLRRRDD